ncbi:MAG: SAM-dependent chlorinase/fluorinase, partial [bacterium]
MKNAAPIITLLSDFGDTDGYVGSMKGVIHSILPQARVVDISHHISPFHTLSAAYVLKTYYRYFPPGTVHVVVVDPGVGGTRRDVVVKADGYYFIAPDNGVLSYITGENGNYRAREIKNKKYTADEISATFHGRDVFAPAAAHLAGGVKIQEFGPPAKQLLVLSDIRPDITLQRVNGKIIHIDHFGNLITNITSEHLVGFDKKSVVVHTSGRTAIGLSDTYCQGKRGDIIIYFGSSGHLEIGTVEDSASFL